MKRILLMGYFVLSVAQNVYSAESSISGSVEKFVISTDSSKKKVAVLEVPYYICLAADHRKKLACNSQGHFSISTDNTDNNVSNLFTISLQGESYVLKAGRQKRILNEDFRLVDKNQGLLLGFRKVDSTSYLTYKMGSNGDSIDSETHSAFGNNSTPETLWVLKPLYDFSSNLGRLNENFLLYEWSQNDLSREQLKGLLELAGHKDFSILGQGNRLFIATKDMPYKKGIYISADKDCVLKITNIKDCLVGVGANCEESLRKGTIHHNEEVVLNCGETLFIRPTDDNGSPVAFGDIEIDKGLRGYLNGYLTNPTFNSSPLVLSSLILLRGENQGSDHVGNNYIVNVSNDSKVWLKFTNTDVGLLSNMGSLAYLMDVVTGKNIDKVGNHLLRSTDRLAQGGENMALTLKSASDNACTSLRAVSCELSGVLRTCATLLDNSLMNATNSFNLGMLCLREGSGDLKRSATLIAGSVKRASEDLKCVLNYSSASLSNGSTTLKGCISEASQSFERAFSVLSSALQDAGNSHERALGKASADFVKGMENIYTAADQLKSVELKHSANCSIQ